MVVFVKAFDKKRVVIAQVRKTSLFCIRYTIQVNHSQRMSEKPLTPWVVSEEDGRILAAHYDCMAGLDHMWHHYSLR